MRVRRSANKRPRSVLDDRARHQGLTLILFMIALAAVVTATLMTV